jgi:hypothetical protein
MAWVTWRQHRLQALAGGATLFILAVGAFLTSLPIRAAYHREALAACLPPSSRAGCDLIVRHFRNEFLTGVNGARGLVILPALAGVFVGAPLLARELEHDTHRLAWTQTISRQRWLLWKSGLVVAGTFVAGVAAAAITTWWREPFDAVSGRIAPGVFDIEAAVVPAYAVFALTVGVVAGLLLRRTIRAIAVTIVVFVAVRLVVARIVRPHFLSAVQESAVASASPAHARDWVLSSTLVDGTGRKITAAREDLAILHAQHGHLDPQEYLDSLGWRRLVSYQPAGRFWNFQLIEAGIFLALAALAVAATVWAIRRTPS